MRSAQSPRIPASGCPRHCDGDIGTIWHKEVANHWRFRNNHWNNRYLTGADNGSQFHVKELGANGWFYQFVIT